MSRQFVAFPSNDRFHCETITNAAKAASTSEVEYTPWSTRDHSGSPIARTVDLWIDEAEAVIADLTYVNDNVTYEIGYAIGAGKPLRLIRNETVSSAELKAMGLLDTILRDSFRTQSDLERILRSKAAPQNAWHEQLPNSQQPIFVLSPPNPTTFYTNLFSSIKKTLRLKFRSFNPREISRLTAEESWEQVASSFGVVVTWSDAQDVEGRRNNQRAAFVFGLASGRHIPTILIAHSRSTLPLDLSDKATRFTNETELPGIMQIFRDEVQDAINESTYAPRLELSLLDSIHCGDPAAENEQDQLNLYFLETEEFRNALNSKTNLIIGRKGSGKSAIFFQVRDRIRANRKNIVVDLNPEGYQLIKLKEMLLQFASIGTRKEFVAAFWQYILWLEIAYKILEKDARAAQRDPELLKRYERLKTAFQSRVDTGTGDFSERLRLLTDQIESRLVGHVTEDDSLMSSRVLEFVYGSSIAEIRTELLEYLKIKGIVVFMFDNLDRMRAPGGFDEADAILILGLIESLQEISKQFRKDKFDFQWIVFIRSDVYEFVVRAMADYGKHAQQSLEWQDRGLLFRLLQQRIMAGPQNNNKTWASIWSEISAPSVAGKDTMNFLIDSCMMRPRYLIRLFESARRRAINIGHQQILEEDYFAAIEELGWTIVEDINLELRDIMTSADSLLYDLGRLNGACGMTELKEAIANRVGATNAVLKVIDVLLWSGAIGISNGKSTTFIFDCGYKLAFMHSIISNSSEVEFCLHETLARCLTN